MRLCCVVAASAGSASQGLAACREHHPALLILDLDLPDAEGLGMARALRREQPLGLVIILSSHARSHQRPMELRDPIPALVDRPRTLVPAWTVLAREGITAPGALGGGFPGWSGG